MCQHVSMCICVYFHVYFPFSIMYGFPRNNSHSVMPNHVKILCVCGVYTCVLRMPSKFIIDEALLLLEKMYNYTKKSSAPSVRHILSDE